LASILILIDGIGIPKEKGYLRRGKNGINAAREG
jgi:hypothetical protein